MDIAGHTVTKSQSTTTAKPAKLARRGIRRTPPGPTRWEEARRTSIGNRKLDGASQQEERFGH
jgi:hypothetical protein